MQRKKVTIDGNEAAAYVAYKINEVIIGSFMNGCQKFMKKSLKKLKKN